MPLLAPNRRALAARFPEVLALLEGCPPAPCPPPPVAEESAAFLAQVAGCLRLLLVLTGLPGRASASFLLAQAPRESIFWCLEPAPGPLAARLAGEDLSAWLTDPRVFVSIGAPSPGEVRRLNRELAWVDRARAICLPTRHRGAETLWQPLLVATLAHIQQRWQNVLTDLRLSPVRWENTCTNLPAFLDSPGIETLAGAFAGTTLVLVAAGPSLDDALPFLRRVAPHALIVTGNTSFRALAAHGLAPHLTVTVDPFRATDLGYAGHPTSDTHLVSPVFAYPGVQRRFAGHRFGLTDESLLLTRLRAAGGLPPGPPLLGNATVSATILNLARHFGCNRVVFVGQDFAVADDGRTHASDTFYTDLGCNRQDGEPVHRLPGTTRPEVTVPARHLWYLRTVEHQLTLAPQIHFLNTSHQGAAIAGAPFADYDTVAALLTAAPPRDFAAELRLRHSATPPPAARAAMAAELAGARTAMREALQLALAASLANEFAVAEPSPANLRQFDTAARRFDQWRGSRGKEERLLFEGRTKPEIFAAEQRRLRLPATDPARPLREAGEMSWAFAEGAAELHRRLAPLELPA